MLPLKRSRSLCGLRIMLAASCLLAMTGCGMTSTRLVVPEAPAALMVPPIRLSSLELKPAGQKLELSDIDAEHRREAILCGDNESQLLALQSWLTSIQSDVPMFSPILACSSCGLMAVSLRI